jgi:hypothetical protein
MEMSASYREEEFDQRVRSYSNYCDCCMPIPPSELLLIAAALSARSQSFRGRVPYECLPKAAQIICASNHVRTGVSEG